MREDWHAFANAKASVEAASRKEPPPVFGTVQLASETTKHPVKQYFDLHLVAQMPRRLVAQATDLLLAI